MSKTSIEWTDFSWNPIIAINKATRPTSKRNKGYGSGIGHYCQKVSAGCKHCYAEQLQPRFGNHIKYSAPYMDMVEIKLDEEILQRPLKWKKPRRVFVCDMSDLFGEWVKDEWIDKIFAVTKACPHLTFQLLTKRPERFKPYFNRTNVFSKLDNAYMQLMRDGINLPSKVCYQQAYGKVEGFPLPNVWLGVSVENQEQAFARIPLLLTAPAEIRWLSCEPLLGKLDLTSLEVPHHNQMFHLNPLTGKLDMNDGIGLKLSKLDWIVAGGTSGLTAPPSHPNWFRSLRDQCRAANVPFFFKQWGAWSTINSGPLMRKTPACEINEDGNWLPYPQSGNTIESVAPSVTMYKNGKTHSGNELDGVKYLEFPLSRTEGFMNYIQKIVQQ